MKAIVKHLPETDHPYKGWLVIELANGIISGIRNDHVKIPHQDLVVDMVVKASLRDDGHIEEVILP